MEPVTLSGVVTPFQGNGRKFGYPTANITTQTDLADGVYFGYADLATFKEQPALIFIGVPLTVGDVDRRLEVYLLDIPDEDYYHETLSVRIECFHRANQKFDSIDELLEIMKADEATGRAWLTTSTPQV